jgi:hypothetical protein
MMKIEVVSGVEGSCLVVNNSRISGPKPWGGGTVIHMWDLTPKEVEELAKICNETLSNMKA